MESAEQTIARQERKRQLARGKRAENVASWYFRLNGFLSIPGFVVHPDTVSPTPITEADLIAVRFPYSGEVIAGVAMVDDDALTELASHPKTLFLLIEVTTDLCKINDRWRNLEYQSMQRVIRRLGFVDPSKVEEISGAMYSNLRWCNADAVVQYLTIGRRENPGLQRLYPQLIQITWDAVSDFLYRRFELFPEKLRNGDAVHGQWPEFGKHYGRTHRRLSSEVESRDFVWEYIDKGKK